VSHFGYKAHINIDHDWGFIRRYWISDAAVHDAKEFFALLG
jgi:transposase, IS5 family